MQMSKVNLEKRCQDKPSRGSVEFDHSSHKDLRHQLAHNKLRVVLVCQLDELLSENTSWPKNVQDLSEARCIETIQLLLSDA